MEACIGGCNVEINDAAHVSFSGNCDCSRSHIGRCAKYPMLRQKRRRGFMHVGWKISLQKRIDQPIENGMPGMNGVGMQTIFEIIQPGTWIDDPDEVWAHELSSLLLSLESAYFEAYTSLILYKKQKDAKLRRLGSDIERRRANISQYMDELRAENAALQAEAYRRIGKELDLDNWDEYGRTIGKIKVEKELSNGNLPSSMEHRVIFIFAKAFLYSLDQFQQTLLVLKEDPKVGSVVAPIYDDFQKHVPLLRATRNSAHHMEDRVRGLAGIGKNKKKIIPKPVQNGAIDAPGGVLTLQDLFNDQLSYTSEQGDLVYVEVSEGTLRAAQSAYQRLLNHLQWKGPSSFLP
jgi:hypothetical protein